MVALLAERKFGDLMTDPEFLKLVALLAATLLVAAAILAWLGRWRKRQFSEESGADLEQFGNYRKMFERGELTKAEYDRIRLKQARRLSNKLGRPSAGPKEDPSQPSPKEPDAPPTRP